ncbi:MAG: ribonuclease III [Acidimicrobiaceae bacterium]|nr:ribonuclease III [Acidimicrobiaceae bacterium]
MGIVDLAVRCGLSPDEPRLLEALTHSSYAAEHGVDSNERLEFLGDAVVDLAVAEYVVEAWPDVDEGVASVVRSRTVNEASLADAARELGLGDLLRTGRGVQKERGAERDSLLADAFEALAGALFSVRGYGPARDFVVQCLDERIEEAGRRGDIIDVKTRLRRLAEARGFAPPEYTLSASGPAHDVTYVARVVAGPVSGEGQGPSKKRAEAAAAAAAWEEAQRAGVA